MLACVAVGSLGSMLCACDYMWTKVSRPAAGKPAEVPCAAGEGDEQGCAAWRCEHTRC